MTLQVSHPAHAGLFILRPHRACAEVSAPTRRCLTTGHIVRRASTRSLAHYLGHRNLQSTARYTALALDRFAKFWRD
jgi:hypothetical protein